MSLDKVFKVVRSIDEIGKDVDLLSDDPFFTYGWFKTLEIQRTFSFSPIYVAVYDENKLVAFAPFFLNIVEFSSKSPFIARALLNLIKGLFFGTIKELNCYSPRCYRGKILFSDKKEEKLILNLLCKEIDLICAKEKILKSQFAYISEFDDSLFDGFKSYGYQRIKGITTYYLDVEWSSFDEYLKSLLKKNRSNVTREIRKCIENGVTIEEPELGNLATKLSELYTNLSLRYNKDAKLIFDPSFFKNLDMYAKEKIKLFTAKKNGETVGFSLSLRHKEVLDVVLVGFDYDAQSKTDFSYFNLAYYSPLKWGMENGIKKIYYRLTMEKIKIARGCKPERTFDFVKYHNTFINTIYSKVLKNSFLNRLKAQLG
jgi:predicted N-acyltransferase